MTKIKLKDLEAMLDAKISALLTDKKEEQEVVIEVEEDEVSAPAEENTAENAKITELEAKITELQKKNDEWEKTWNNRSEQSKEITQPVRKGWGK